MREAAHVPSSAAFSCADGTGYAGDAALTILRWMPPHFVHRMVQYSALRPAIMRSTASWALQSGQQLDAACGEGCGPGSVSHGGMAAAISASAPATVKSDVRPMAASSRAAA